MAENARDADVDGGKPSTDALLSAKSARPPLALALLQVTGDVLLRWHTAGDLDACAGERAPHNWCIMLPLSQRVQPGVYTLMALSRYRDALSSSKSALSVRLSTNLWSRKSSLPATK